MLTFKLFFVSIAIVSTNAYLNFNKTHYIYLEDWGSIDVKYKDGQVMYSNCTTKGATVKNCTVVMERSLTSNDSLVCDISLKSEDERGMIGKKMKLLGALGYPPRKVVFFWHENNKRRGRYFTYGLLNMFDCKFDTVKFDKRLVTGKTTAVLYDNSFDVFFNDRTTCGEKICRISYESDGWALNKQHGFVEGNLIEKDFILKPLYSTHPEFGYFYVKVERTNEFEKNNFTTAYYLLQNGTETLLKRLDGRPDMTFSEIFGTIIACATYKKNKGNIDCIILEPRSKNVTELKLSSKDSRSKQVISIRNSSYGIAVVYRTSEHGDIYTNLTLGIFDWKGELIRSTPLKNDCGETQKATEFTEEHFCIVNRCIKDPDNMWGEKEVTFNFQCFDDDDLDNL